jgi:hypothetical protein
LRSKKFSNNGRIYVHEWDIILRLGSG